MAQFRSDLARKLHRRALNATRRMRRPHVARIDTSGTRLTMTVAGRARFLELSRPLPAFETFDFAVFALAAMSMRRAIPIRFDLPVSESAARSVAHLATTMQLRAPTILSPLDLELTHIVADRAPGRGGIMCLSGGVDSTHLALTLPGFTHGLAIHGFDFPLSATTGFQGRRARIGRIAARTGLEVVDLTTNLSKSMHPFETMNVFYLATCLHFAGYGLGQGAFAGDLTPRYMPISPEHGMVLGIDRHLSTRAFPVRLEGWRENRGEKTLEIEARAPELLKDLAFCFDAVDTGGNCGTCEKCMHMRFCMDYAGVNQSLIFGDAIDPIPYYEKMAFGSAHHAAIYVERLSSGIDVMPDGDRRRRLIRICEAARARHLGVRNPRIHPAAESAHDTR